MIVRTFITSFIRFDNAVIYVSVSPDANSRYVSIMSMICTMWSYTSRRYVRVASDMQSCDSRVSPEITSRIGHAVRRNSSSSRFAM